MGVALDVREPLHPHRAGAADPPEVVPREVHQHHVLGALLGVGHQLRLQVGVRHRSRAAAPRAGDRRDRRHPALEPHQLLRRRADERLRADAQEEVVGRWVHQPQRAVERERRDVGLGGKLLRGDDLHHFARPYRLLALRHHPAELGLGHLGTELRQPSALPAAAPRDAPLDRLSGEQALVEDVDLGHRLVVAAGASHLGDRHRRAHRVEHRERVHLHERLGRRALLVPPRDAQLEVRHRLVGKIPHAPALEGRQLVRRGERCRRVRHAAAEAEVGIPALAVAVVDAFQQEHVVLSVRHPRKHRHRRLAVGEELAVHRGPCPARGPSLEGLPCQHPQHFHLLLSFLKFTFFRSTAKQPRSFTKRGCRDQSQTTRPVTTLRKRGASARRS